ncbi:MAG: sensor histidine kinase [Ketobacter sp.]|nr:MAG: sensor histidine kinase [Ketobacter sp.]
MTGARYLLWYNGVLALIMASAAWAMHLQGFQLPMAMLSSAVAGQALLTGISVGIQPRLRTDQGLVYLGILLVSMFNLAVYLFATGGHTNPVISLLLLPLALSAVALRPWQTLSLALVVVVLYTALTHYFLPLSMPEMDHANHGAQGDSHQSFMQLHLFGMWLTFAISALLICALVIPLAQSVREQQQLISQQREKMLQDEQLVALATFAASAAHKMGTPLSTLSILVDDFKDLVQGQPEWQQDRELMAQQIELCRSILQGMMQRADSLRQNRPAATNVGDLLQQVREQFNLLHPSFELQLDNQCCAGVVIADGTLEQALLNLLDNAVRASDHAPVLHAVEEDGFLRLEIHDSGPGIPETIQQQLGQPLVSSRKDGLGLGLFLSHATVERLGGELSLHSSDDGTTIKVSLPLQEESHE